MSIEELTNQFRHMVENRQLKKSSVILNAMLESIGLSEVVDVVKEFGCKISVCRKNPAQKHELVITNHARERTITYLQSEMTDEQMKSWIMNGTVMEYSDILALGYRPSKDNAERSIYIQLPQNLVAVLEIEEHKLIWITTYSMSRTPKNYIPITQKEFDRLCKIKKKNSRRRT